MTFLLAPPAAGPAPVAPARPDTVTTAPPVPTELGRRAVTASADSQTLRLDPGPPRVPAPIKGLGIPPLNTRQVGDFDKLDDPVPPVGVALSDRLADLATAPRGDIDLRR